LVQGINYYRHKDSENAIGLMHWDIGGYKPHDIEVVSAFDIDKRKVGKDVAEAIFAEPIALRFFTKMFQKSAPLYGWGRSWTVSPNI